jgi:hypothetical protein
VATFVYASSQGQRTHSARTKIILLIYAFAQMDAPNASQFESYANEMEKWMKNSKAREKALENWYKFWYNSRTLWSNA